MANVNKAIMVTHEVIIVRSELKLDLANHRHKLIDMDKKTKNPGEGKNITNSIYIKKPKQVKIILALWHKKTQMEMRLWKY